MAEFLVIRLRPSADEPVSWIAVDDRGTRRGPPGSGSLEDAAREVRDRGVIVLVPGIDVLTLSADIPARGARLLAALPFALEDQVAEDIEHLHFAAGARRADGSVPVAVVRHDTMLDWRARLDAAGITAARIVPENHGLARTPNTMSMLVSDGVVMFNDGGEIEFVLPDVAPAEALAATGIIDGSDDGSSRHLLVYCNAADAERYEKDWALLRHELAGVDVNLLPDGVLPRLAITVANGAGINLLQGRYGKKTDVGAVVRPWRNAAALLLALVLVGLVARSIDLYRLNQEADVLQAHFTDEYRRLRPNDTRDIVDPVGTVNSLRRSQGVTVGGPQLFLPSLYELSQAVNGNAAVKIEAISYRAGVVDVRLTAPDIPTLDAIVQAIGASGQFSATMQSADRVGELVNSRIQIREADA